MNKNIYIRLLELSCKWFAYCYIVFFAMASIAAEQVDSATTSTIKNGVGAGNLLQVLVALVAVIGVIYFLSLVLKKFNMMPGPAAGPIQIISGISLSNKDRLLLVQVGSDQILISTSPGNVRKIHKLSSHIDPSEFNNTTINTNNSFMNVLNMVSSRQNK